MGILDDAGINAEKAVVNLGVDTKRFVPSKNKAAAKKKLGINPKSTVIGYCGRMSEEKDVPTLIRAFLRLSEKKNNLSCCWSAEARYSKNTLSPTETSR
jgi:glycosyltransferase involved in cell wall biosynthesis